MSNNSTDICVLVSSFNRPRHLRRVLESIAFQRDVDHQFEVVVTDDGSDKETLAVVEQFATNVDFQVQLTTHPHDGFQLARCRNEGVAVSSSPYLLFLDGDCLIPPDHLRHHLDNCLPKCVMAGYCCLLDQRSSESLSLQDVRTGKFLELATSKEHRKLRRMHRKAIWYTWTGHRTKPKLYGGNVGIFRTDYEQVNGYDEKFVGWGCEDDDLRLRLRRAGIGIRSILHRTRTYHLWHPKAQSTPDSWRDGANVSYLQRTDRPSYCELGLSRYRDEPVKVSRWNTLHRHVA